MAPSSAYLLRPLRTFRQACRDISRSHPELLPPEFDAYSDLDTGRKRDYNLAIKNKGHPPKSWRREISGPVGASRCGNLNVLKQCLKLPVRARRRWRTSGPGDVGLKQPSIPSLLFKQGVCVDLGQQQPRWSVSDDPNSGTAFDYQICFERYCFVRMAIQVAERAF